MNSLFATIKITCIIILLQSVLSFHVHATMPIEKSNSIADYVKENFSSQPKPLINELMRGNFCDLLEFYTNNELIVGLFNINKLGDTLETQFGPILLYNIASKKISWSTERNFNGCKNYEVFLRQPYIIILGTTSLKTTLTALDPENGSIKWNYDISGHNKSFHLLENKILIIQTSDASTCKINAMELSGGRIIWNRVFNKSKNKKNLIAKLAIFKDKIFMLHDKIYLLDGHTGKTEDSVDIHFDISPNCIFINVEENIIIIDRKMCSLFDVKKNKIKWKIRLNYKNLIDAEVKDDKLYLISELKNNKDGNTIILAIDLLSGGSIWKFSTPNRIRSKMLLIDDRIIFSNDDCILALNSNNGKIYFMTDKDMGLNDIDYSLPDIIHNTDSRLVLLREGYGAMIVSEISGKMILSNSVPESTPHNFNFYKSFSKSIKTSGLDQNENNLATKYIEESFRKYYYDYTINNKINDKRIKNSKLKYKNLFMSKLEKKLDSILMKRDIKIGCLKKRELSNLIETHLKSLQWNYYLRPFSWQISPFKFAYGISITEIISGEQNDFLFSLRNRDFVFESGFEPIPKLIISPDTKWLATFGISIYNNNNEINENDIGLSSHPSLIIYDTDSLINRKLIPQTE